MNCCCARAGLQLLIQLLKAKKAWGEGGKCKGGGKEADMGPAGFSFPPTFLGTHFPPISFWDPVGFGRIILQFWDAVSSLNQPTTEKKTALKADDHKLNSVI